MLEGGELKNANPIRYEALCVANNKIEVGMIFIEKLDILFQDEKDVMKLKTN